MKVINMLLWKFRVRGMHTLDCIHRCNDDALLPAKQHGLWGVPGTFDLKHVGVAGRVRAFHLSGVVASTRFLMSALRKPFETLQFGEEMVNYADVYLKSNGPETEEWLTCSAGFFFFCRCGRSASSRRWAQVSQAH